MPEVGFEPTITASERAETVNAIDRSATVTGRFLNKTEFYRENLGKFLLWNATNICPMGAELFPDERGTNFFFICAKMSPNLFLVHSLMYAGQEVIPLTFSSYHSVRTFRNYQKTFHIPVAMNFVPLSRDDRCQPPVQSSQKCCPDFRFRLLHPGIFSKKTFAANG
jgi:hypothetical protein